MAVQFVEVTTEKHRKQLAAAADEVWHEFFSELLSLEQIDYMVDRFQSLPALTKQMQQEGYRYFFLCDGGKTLEDGSPAVMGYTGVRVDGDKLFLSKLYLLAPFRGQGYASQAFAFLTGLCKGLSLKAIWLTVNRHNKHSIAVYKARGFETVREQVTEIGHGFVMDDYVMELQVQ